MVSMIERCFGSPGKCWRASWAKGEEANQPTKGWCAPHTLSHVTWGGGAPPPGLGGKPPPAWLGGQVSLGFSLGRSNLLGRRPLGETLGRLPLPLPLYIVEVLGLHNTRVSLSQGATLPLSLLVSRSAWRSPAGVPRSSTTTTPSCFCWMESSPTSPSPLAGSRRRRRHRAARVFNAEAPWFGA